MHAFLILLGWGFSSANGQRPWIRIEKLIEILVVHWLKNTMNWATFHFLFSCSFTIDTEPEQLKPRKLWTRRCTLSGCCWSSLYVRNCQDLLFLIDKLQPFPPSMTSVIKTHICQAPRIFVVVNPIHHYLRQWMHQSSWPSCLPLRHPNRIPTTGLLWSLLWLYKESSRATGSRNTQWIFEEPAWDGPLLPLCAQIPLVLTWEWESIYWESVGSIMKVLPVLSQGW